MLRIYPSGLLKPFEDFGIGLTREKVQHVRWGVPVQCVCLTFTTLPKSKNKLKKAVIALGVARPH
jgi:hypothetical protein